MLLSAAVSAGVPPQDAPSAAQASQPPQPQVQDAQTRGVSAQAATDAVASQLPPTDPVSQSSAAPQALAAGDAVPASIAPRLPVAPVLRGVLFRVTPPAASEPRNRPEIAASSSVEAVTDMVTGRVWGTVAG